MRHYRLAGCTYTRCTKVNKLVFNSDSILRQGSNFAMRLKQRKRMQGCGYLTAYGNHPSSRRRLQDTRREKGSVR